MRAATRTLALVLVFLLLPLSAREFAPPEVQAVDRLLSLVRARLELAVDVARVKWNTGQPIEDPVREAQILQRLGGDGSVQSFFRDQIEAGKLVQRQLHATWRASRQPPFETVADLGSDLRPRFDALTGPLLKALAEVAPVRASPDWPALLEGRARACLRELTPEVRQRALQSLAASTAGTVDLEGE